MEKTMTPQEMSFLEAVVQGFRKYFDFKGRARRTEYWCWTLFTITVNIIATIIDGEEGGVWSALAGLILFIPGLSVTVRRLHDIGRSGWWLGGYYLICIIATTGLIVWAVSNGVSNYPDIPDSSGFTLQLVLAVLLYILAIAVFGFTMLVWYCTPGTIGPNKYGEDPKYTLIPAKEESPISTEEVPINTTEETSINAEEESPTSTEEAPLPKAPRRNL